MKLGSFNKSEFSPSINHVRGIFLLKQPYFWVTAISFLSILSLQSCNLFGGDEGEKNNSLTMKDLLKKGVYSISVDTSEGNFWADYRVIQDQNGIRYVQDFEWNNDSSKWVKEKEYPPYKDSEIYESKYLKYKQGVWIEIINNNENTQNQETMKYTTSGDWLVEVFNFELSIPLKSIVDISGKKIDSVYKDLKNLVPENAVFKNGSQNYLTGIKVPEELYSFYIEERDCDTSMAVKGKDNKLTCPQDTWYSKGESSYNSFAEFRDEHSSYESSIYEGNLKFHFVNETKEVVIWIEEYEYISDRGDSYKMLEQKGSWQEMNVGGREILKINLPSEAPKTEFFGLGEIVYLLEGSKIYEGNYYKKGVESDEVPYSLPFNDTALQSILEFFTPPKRFGNTDALRKQSTSKSKKSIHRYKNNFLGWNLTEGDRF